MGKRGPKPYNREQKIEAFWKKVDKRGTDDCWIWTGKRDGHGYGIFRGFSGKGEQASRFSLELSTGVPLKEGECALHNCPNGDNPSCVNPGHLWIGTKADNNTDKMEKGRSS